MADHCCRAQLALCPPLGACLVRESAFVAGYPADEPVVGRRFGAGVRRHRWVFAAGRSGSDLRRVVFHVGFAAGLLRPGASSKKSLQSSPHIPGIPAATLGQPESRNLGPEPPETAQHGARVGWTSTFNGVRRRVLRLPALTPTGSSNSRAGSEMCEAGPLRRDDALSGTSSRRGAAARRWFILMAARSRGRPNGRTRPG